MCSQYPNMALNSQQSKPHQQQPKFVELNDLATDRIGGTVLFATDEYFAVADNLLKTDQPEWKEGVFTECGKWMDGWETRRRKTEGYDWCIVQLGKPGLIYGIDVDTSYFTGNFAPRCSLQAACLDKSHRGRPGKRKHGAVASVEEEKTISQLNSEKWEFLVPLSQLQPGYATSCHNYFVCNSMKRFTHLRLNIYPDGGIARLRVYGQVVPDWSQISTSQTVDLVAMDMGGMCVGYSDAHYGHPRNLIKGEKGESGGDGWLTARKATRPSVIQANSKGNLYVPGTEWCVFKLGHPGVITQIEVDTNHFQGNYPDSCKIEACSVVDKGDKLTIEIPSHAHWKTLLPAAKLKPNTRFFLDQSKMANVGVISHIRVVIAPDGGLSRIRLWGHKANKNTAKL